MVMPENDTNQKQFNHSIKLPYLYREGSKILQAYDEKKGSLKSLVYATHAERLYRRLLALVCRAVQHREAVDAALASCRLLEAEPGLAPSTARLLTAELLFGAGRLDSQARPALTVLRYADRLRAAAAEAGAGAGAAADSRPTLPRYARVNTLLTSVDDVINQLTDEGWERVKHSPEIQYEDFIAQVKSLSEGQFLLDLHVPCLLVFPAGTELHQHPLYRGGQLILQDKASCLPAVVLAPSAGDHVIDACAAPGMKTSQLAAIMNNTGTLVAVERDSSRFHTLSSMLRKAGVTNTRLVKGDFMKLRPEEHPRVTAILLDPSCSGTGMVSREPEPPPSEERLRRLANLQSMLLRHALSFPAVRRVVYSTCSVTEQENEQVVAAILSAHPDWRLTTAAPATWRRRGRTTLPGGGRCIRAEPAEDLCHGFFVAAFERVDGGKGTDGERSKRKRKRGKSVQGSGGEMSEEGGVSESAAECVEEGNVEDADGLQDKGPKKKKKKRKHAREEVVGSGDSESAVKTLVEDADGVQNEEPKRKKKKRRHAREEVVGNGGADDDVPYGASRTHANVTVEAEKSDHAAGDQQVKRKNKKKRKRSETAENDEACSSEGSIKGTQGESEPADVESSSEVRRKRKKEKQDRKTMLDNGDNIAESAAEERVNENKEAWDIITDDNNVENIPANGSRKNKKKKRERSEKMGSTEADPTSTEQSRNEKNRCSNGSLEAKKPDDIPGKSLKKKRRQESGGNGIEALDNHLTNVSKANGERSEAPRYEGGSCEVSVGAGEGKKKKKRRRSRSDDRNEKDVLPAKQARKEEAGVMPMRGVGSSKCKKTKRHKKSGRLSKRRRMVLKWKKSAAVSPA